jgi:hypothetical protein
MKLKARPLDVTRASRPLWRRHPFAALRAGSACASFDLPFSHDVMTSLVRERDAPATAGETPALPPLSPQDPAFMLRTSLGTNPCLSGPINSII